MTEKIEVQINVSAQIQDAFVKAKSVEAAFAGAERKIYADGFEILTIGKPGLLKGLGSGDEART